MTAPAKPQRLDRRNPEGYWRPDERRDLKAMQREAVKRGDYRMADDFRRARLAARVR